MLSAIAAVSSKKRAIGQRRGGTRRRQAVAWSWWPVGAIGVLLQVTGPAYAQFEVESPRVDAGVLELEALGSVQSRFPDEEEEGGDEADDEGEEDEENQRQRYEFSVGYGITEFWRPELGLVLEQRKGRDLKADAVEIQNTFQVLSTDLVEAGLLLAYEGSLRDDLHALEWGPLAELSIGRLTSTANGLFERPFGDDRETPTVGFAYAWQSMVDIAGGLGVGFEAFGEIEKIANDPPSLSEQEHRLGPVALFELALGDWGEIGIELGFLFGLTDATPDNTFKFNLEFEWGPEGSD